MRKYVVIVREEGVEVHRQLLFVGAMTLKASTHGEPELVMAATRDMPDLPGGPRT